MQVLVMGPGGVLPRLPGMRSCVSQDGRCSCGWTATGPDVDAEELDHLYSDLTGAARAFAYRA